ncbi:hypothetical protein FKM82_019903 [Ascaphus truei]
MMLIAFLCLSTFMQHFAVQGEAYLGPLLIEYTNVKSRSAGSSISSSGRPVSIPTENILNMAGVPFSTLLTNNNVTVKNIIVNTHNILRSQVNPPASNMLKMRWNDEAAKTAERWANTCNAFHSPKELRQITDFSCGENLFMSTFKASWKDVIESFYSEVVDFEYGKGAKIPGQEIGHYTQVVWFRSFQVGCSVVFCPESQYQYLYVCHYCPPGNNVDSMGYPYKAGPACGDCPNSCDNGLCTNYCPRQDWYSNCIDFMTDNTCADDVEKDCPAMCNCNNNEIK